MKCFICGRYGQLDTHHIFGAAFRKKSDKYGLTVKLCRACHTETPNGVHCNKDRMLELKQYGQRRAMKENNWTIEEFRGQFGKNYI